MIAEVKKANKLKDEFSVFLTFKFDIDIVNMIRKLQHRFWHVNDKQWELSITDFKKLQSQVLDITIIDEDNILNRVEEQTKEVVKVLIPNNYAFKTTPYKHQLDGIEYGLNHNHFLLGDEQGLGKTMQVINIACIEKQLYNYKHCLIICGVNGLKWNWKNEVEKHSNENAYILGTRIKHQKEEIGSVAERIEDLDLMLHKNAFNDCYFIITNVETLRDDDIQKTLKKLCEKKIINIIAFDEFHKVKNPTSQQGKAILKLQAEKMIAMTGTPLMNSPIDLYMPLKWLGYEEHSFYQFKNHYCIMGGYGGYEIVGYKNLDQLQEQLQQIQIRRLKKDVLDLPEKIYVDEFVEMTPKQSKIYKEVKLEIRDNIDMVLNAPNPLTEMIRLRQATGYTGILSSTIQESAKFERLVELVDEAIENDDKVIIFSNWTAITNPLYKLLHRYKPAIITGQTKDRVAEQDNFMNDEDCKVIIGTTGAMGTGLTLTAARTVIFMDEPWNRALKEQAEDRAHRIGTKGSVNIITLMCKNTIDERIHELVETKGKIADILVDGRMADTNKEELVNFLLS